MAATALTASVWGQGRQAMALSAQAAQRVGHGQEECHICRDDIPATIAFVPCKHKVCFSCVESMRAKNIFKADKGIKCPFCRQYVDGYESLLPSNPQVDTFLAEANKAANIAAQARYASEQKSLQQQGYMPQQPAAPAVGQSAAVRSAGGNTGAGSVASSGEDQTWHCGSCLTTNYLWRDFCSKCKKTNPNSYGTDKQSKTWKDISNMSRSEFVSLVQDRGAFGIRRALIDMGITIDTTKAYGSVASVREAVAVYGLKKRVLHMAELLSEPAVLKEASLHPLGNLAVQRLIECFAKLRQAFPASRPNQDLEAYKAKHHARDPLVVFFHSIKSHVLEYCLHDKGVYVVQCLIHQVTNSELVALGRAICPLTLPICRDPRGVFVLLSLLDAFSQNIWEDEDNREPALQCVDLICEHFVATEQQLLQTAMHALSGKVLVRAIAVSMPRFPALRTAVKVACHASMLAATPGGLATLSELIQLHGHNQEAMEGLRDVVTCMCYSLQGNIKLFALQRDDTAFEFLLYLVERLALEQETGWLDSIAQELVGVADQLQRHQEGLEVLKFILSQPVVDLDTVTLHISDLKTCLGKAALIPIVADIMERVAHNPQPPPPRYPAASVIQPELKYYLDRGWPTPLPPPPPPRPGQPGYEDYISTAATRAEAQAAAAAAKVAAVKARRDAVKAAVAAAAVQQVAPAPSGSGSSGSSISAATAAAVTDAWCSPAISEAQNNAWQVSPVVVDDNAAASIAEANAQQSSPGWTADGNAGSPTAAAAAAANPWGAVLESPNHGGSSSSRAWGVDNALEHPPTDTVNNSISPQAAAVAAPPVSLPLPVTAAATPAAQSTPTVPIALPVAVPIAVPVAIPVAIPASSAAAAAPVAAPQQVLQQGPTQLPAAAAEPASRVMPPVPMPRLQQQQHTNFRTVADFTTAAPARLNPGSSPEVRIPLQQQPPQQQQQQQQQRPQRPSSSSSIEANSSQQWPGLQEPQQQQQRQRQRPVSAPQMQQPPPPQVQPQQQVLQPAAWSCNVCTYEHTGSEAEFLFCAMCSTQRSADV